MKDDFAKREIIKAIEHYNNCVDMSRESIIAFADAFEEIMDSFTDCAGKKRVADFLNLLHNTHNIDLLEQLCKVFFSSGYLLGQGKIKLRK